MRFADAKDIKRAQDLGKHSGSVHMSRIEIARGKASAMAQAITDKRKILGRLEAIASEWEDREILMHFINKCRNLWPNSIYTQAYWVGERQGKYMNKMRPNWRQDDNLELSIRVLRKKGIISSDSGKTITGYEYQWDPVAVIIFNTVFKYNL
jgi:hypothetical protein